MLSVDDRPRELLLRTESEDEDRVRLIVKDVGVGFDPQLARLSCETNTKVLWTFHSA